MEFDLTKLSDKDLSILKRQVDKTIKEREVENVYKSSFGVPLKLITRFNDELVKHGISTLDTKYYLSVSENNIPDVPHYWWPDTYEKAIFKLCDLALGNWKAGKKDRNGVARIQSGPAVIPPSIDGNRYRNMIDDIFKVIDNYHVEKKG